MNQDERRNEWTHALNAARDAVDNLFQPDALLDAGERLLAIARWLAGVACAACSGMGTRAYGSTSLWGSGIGGQQVTEGTCDVCWGTGRSDRRGPDLRALRREGHDATGTGGDFGERGRMAKP